ncbi:TRAP transporter small permease [bacterium LRH843]|nr:TRAP transporter small permease [bacterium LRH843]
MKRWFNAIDDVIATIALVGVIGLTIVNVFTRYVLNHPVQWVEEIAIGLFIWLVFVGVSSTMKRDGHIGVDYFVNKMPRPVRIVSQVIRAVAMYYVLFYVFIYLGLSLVSQAADKVTPILTISYQLIDIAVPIGGLLAAVHFTRSLIRTFRAEFGNKGGS